MSNFDDRCPNCRHWWHGMTCRVDTCGCLSAWSNPEGDQ